MKRVFIAGLALLAGCADQQAARPPVQAPAQVSAPARPAEPVARYDGRYTGSISNLGGGFSCTNRLSGQRTLTITDGRASADMAPGRASPLRGTVQEDGALRAVDPIDRGSIVAGQIVNNQFVGTWQNGRCNYELSLRKQ